MHLIKSVEVVAVDGRMASVAKLVENEITFEFAPYSNDPQEVLQIEQELVEGTRFRNPATGEDIVVGMTEEVQKLIGLPMEAFANMTASAEKTRWELTDLRDTVKQFEHMGWRDRLRFLFTGWR